MAALVPVTELDVEEVCATALSQFGEAWHNDNVNYGWILEHWSKTHGLPRPKNWPSKNIKQLEAAVREKMTATHPPSDPASSRQTRNRSRSPHRLQADTVSSQTGGFHSSNYSWCEDDLQKRKQSIVRDLMEQCASALPEDPNWHPELYVPRQTIDAWVEELHNAVNESSHCAWPPGMTKRQQGVHAVGIATLSYGYCFKFRFVDNGVGTLVWHGSPASSVFPILRNSFMPRVTDTFSGELLKQFGCVPPLVWCSSSYKTAARYPSHLWVGNLPVGERIALDISQSLRFVFHVRVKKEERLANPPRKSEKNQQGYSPVSVLSIVGLDAIALSMSYAQSSENWPTYQLSDFSDIDALENWLATWILDNRPAPEFCNLPLDPRGLITRSPEHMTMMKRLFDRREQLLQDQAEIVAFHNDIATMDGPCTAEYMCQLLEGLSERVRALVVRCTMGSPEDINATQAAIDATSEALNSPELAQLPTGRRRGTVTGTNAIKKYKRVLRAAKHPDLCEKQEVYEWACPTPILAPERIPQKPPAVVSSGASSNSCHLPQ